MPGKMGKKKVGYTTAGMKQVRKAANAAKPKPKKKGK